MIRLVLVAALALGVAGCNTSNNYFTEEVSDDGREMTAFGSFLSMAGVIPEEDDGIEYRPRAPLAIPGSTELPDPESASAAQQAVNFPVDDDERRRQRRERLRDLGGDDPTWMEELTGNPQADRVGPEVMGNFRRARGTARVEQDEWKDGEERLGIREMMARLPGGGGRNRILTEEGKPMPRKSLLHPPDAYRTPAETAALPENKRDIEHSEWVKQRVYDVGDRRPVHLRNQPANSGGAAQYQGPGF
jgi:hypothetical protein